MNFLTKGSAIVLGTLALSAAGLTAFADTTPASAVVDTTAATTTANIDSVTPTLREKIGISYLGQVMGPSLAQIGTMREMNFTPDSVGNLHGDDSDLFTIANLMSFSYKIDPRYTAGFVVRGNWKPATGHGHDFAFKTPYAQFTDKKFISVGNFTMSGNARVYMPFTRGAHDTGYLTALGSYDYLNYDIPGTKLSVGSYLFVQYTFYKKEIANAAKQTVINPTPQINYQLTDPVGFWLAYDFAVARNLVEGKYSWHHEAQSVLLGGSFDFDSARYNLSPYLVFPIEGKVNSKSTTIGAYLSARIL